MKFKTGSIQSNNFKRMVINWEKFVISYIGSNQMTIKDKKAIFSIFLSDQTDWVLNILWIKTALINQKALFVFCYQLQYSLQCESHFFFLIFHTFYCQAPDNVLLQPQHAITAVTRHTSLLGCSTVRIQHIWGKTLFHP